VDPIKIVPSIIPPRKQVLLIVDDEPDILESLESLLADYLPGVRVLTASSGAKGMVIARANVLDMVLSDFRMAKMDGIEFLRQARIVQADIPMVIMSADLRIGVRAARHQGGRPEARRGQALRHPQFDRPGAFVPGPHPGRDPVDRLFEHS
jgi:CheY-like chemotaxis protein